MHGESAITVFFDGLCPVCSREVALYRRLDRRLRICWLDIAGPDDVLRDERFTLDAALQLLHVKDRDGVMHVGFDAHLLMWQRLPGFRSLAWALQRCPPARRLLETFYLAFTRRRPGLMRRARSAGDGHV